MTTLIFFPVREPGLGTGQPGEEREVELQTKERLSPGRAQFRELGSVREQFGQVKL